MTFETPRAIPPLFSFKEASSSIETQFQHCKRHIDQVESRFKGLYVSKSATDKPGPSVVAKRALDECEQEPLFSSRKRAALEMSKQHSSKEPLQKRKREEETLSLKDFCVGECLEANDPQYGMGIEETSDDIQEMEVDLEDTSLQPGVTPTLEQSMNSLSIQEADPLLLAKEIIAHVHTRFGIRSQALYTRNQAIDFLSETQQIVDMINNSLPEDQRSVTSSKNLVEEIHLLVEFFENAYDFSLVQAFGGLAGAHGPFCDRLRMTRKWLETANFERITSLNLSGKGLVLLPKVIGKFISLKELDLRNNFLIWLPSEIGNLQALIDLHVNHNYLTSLPTEFGDLQELHKLGLEDNYLESLPPGFANLNSLQVLDIRNNLRLFKRAEFDHFHGLLDIRL